MVACNRSKRVNITTRRAILLVVCFSIAVLTTYRVHLWLSHYTRLASKMMISAYDEQQPDLPFPLVTVCNINPARGSELYNARSVNPVTRGLDYELFSDAYQGRLSENALESKLLTSVYRLMDQASHQLKDMLKSCTVDQKRCYAANFTKSILPPGACYTFNGMTTDFDEFQLTLDPQSFDYLIPNQGFVGFRVLLHTRGDPLWAMMPSAVYAGPTFHTMLRVVGLKKIYKQQCVTQRQWARCIHQCMQDMLHKRCQCHLSDCTLLNMMRCGIRMTSLVEILPPSQCNCQNPCEQITYSIESITQALKAPLFAQSAGIFATANDPADPLWQSRGKSLLSGLSKNNADPLNEPAKFKPEFHSPAKGLEEHRRDVGHGTLIQTWAFLREANRTAFEHLRQLSRLLQSLQMDLQTVERAVTSVQLKQTQLSSQSDPGQPYDWQSAYDTSQTSNLMRADSGNGLCLDAEEHGRILSRVRKLGEEFVRLFRQSVLFRDVPQMPGHDLHVHLVRLFFLRVVPDFDRLANQLQHNDLFSDVTMLDLQRKASQCKQSGSGQIPGSTRGSANRTGRMLANHIDRIQLEQASEDIASLQAVLLATDSQFKQLRSSFIRLTQENRELIEAISLDQLKLGSVAHPGNSFVTMTIQLTRDKNRLVRLESVQAIYNPFTELIDLIVSGLVMAFLAIFLFDICTTHQPINRGLVCCTDPSMSTIEEISPSKPSLIVHGEPLKDCIESTICHTVPSVHSSSEFYKALRPRMDHQNTLPDFSRICTLCSVRTSSEWPVLSPTKVFKQSTSASSVQNSANAGYCMHQTQALCEQSRIERVSALDTDSGKPSSSATTHPSSLLESSSINTWEQPGTSTSRRGTLKCGLFLESPTYLVPSRLVSVSLCERHPNQSNTIGSIGGMQPRMQSFSNKSRIVSEGASAELDNGCQRNDNCSASIISKDVTRSIFFPSVCATTNSPSGSYDGGCSSVVSTKGVVSGVEPYGSIRISPGCCEGPRDHDHSTNVGNDATVLSSFFLNPPDAPRH